MMKIKKVPFIFCTIAVIALFYSFKPAFDDADWLAYTNRCLTESYDQNADPKLKKVDITLTNDYFVRLRRTYNHNQQDYYSFNLNKFDDMDYLGTTASGTLELKTIADDIIVQTRNDRHGDIDTMASVLEIPVKNMEPERLDSLKEAFDYFKAKGL